MENAQKRHLVTAALPYANGPAHLGHIAGVYLPADIYCRFLRMRGEDVVFICGSDEHGVPIMLSARRLGTTPQTVVDQFHGELKRGFDRMEVCFDHYGRTSSAMHRKTSQSFFSSLAEKGAFTTRTETQLYDPEAQLFLADRLIKGECPTCGYEEAYGDQCEQCGRTLSPSELKNPRSTVTDAIPELRETTHWYLPLDKAQGWLEEWIATKKDWKPNVLGQVRSWLQAGLAERSMTRDLPWGVPVPKAVAEAAGVEADGKVLYVWFDAPIGYISATREWAEKQGDPEKWQAYWKDENTRLLHFYAKDNVVFHAIIFPTMLKLKGDFVLPHQEPGNEYLNIKGLKLSTSRGSAIWLNDFLDRYPVDFLRYGLTRMMPETKDSDFTWEGLQALVNNELADTLGNFVNRTMAFAHKHFGGKVPAMGAPSQLDNDLIAAIERMPEKVADSISRFRFRDAAEDMMSLARIGNKYFNDSEPWRTRKTDLAVCGTTIHLSLQVCAALSVLMEPLLPTACRSLRRQLRLAAPVASTPEGQGISSLYWDDAKRLLLESDHELGSTEILFQKITDDTVCAENEALAAMQSNNDKQDEEKPYMELRDTATFDDFMKMDLRVGKVLEAEPVPKSKKLIRTVVDLGFEKRQILAGVAQHFSAESLVGKSVVVVANLAPRKMMGLESQGMILMAEDREGTLAVISADSEPGSSVS